MQNEIAKIEAKFPNNVSLLALYKEEKAKVDMPSAPFMSFGEWKAEYKVEWMDTHVDSRLVDAETAVEESDKIVDEAEKELNVKKETPKVDKPVKVLKVKQPKVEKPKVEKEKKVSKSDLAMEIYKSMMVNGEHPARKDVIDRFVNEVGLTQAGASTYQFNIKKKLGG